MVKAIHSCGGIVENRGFCVADMFIISGGVVIVAIFGVTWEVGVIITITVRIIARERLNIEVGKYKSTWIAVGKGMDTSNDLIRYGDGRTCAAENFLDRGKVHETPDTLGITSGPKGNSNRGTLSYNSDVSIFVRMHIFPKLDLTVLVEIDCLSCDNSTWEKGTGHRIWCWEYMEPKYIRAY